ncbi:hypothetical protein ACCC92_03210 [Mucilaginibacter sp. Mucisp84]|uniref:hypothetical protein n=1 Tax=Mucilaginibacter sp. Mucisp84 TaxID=3243058 RepID=UPI0039A59477
MPVALNQSISMLDNTDYQRRRIYFRDEIESAIGMSSCELSLRGSWKFDDFHLDSQQDLTHSDIDLIAMGPLKSEKELVIAGLQQQISPLLRIRISIHPEDHLSQISLEDSRIKNIYEYLIHFKNAQDPEHPSVNYLKAKIMMLLLKRTERNQRFADIRAELPGPATANLHAIKIGTEKTIDLQALSRLMDTITDPVTLSFYANCIIADPSPQYYDAIHQQFLDCETVSDWLKNYIISKMKTDVG